MSKPIGPDTATDAIFDAYLAHCHEMLGEARAWAATVPDILQPRLVDPAIQRSLLEFLPRMPPWMAEHLNGARPAAFRNPDGSEIEFIEWPFSGLFHTVGRDRQLIEASRVARYRAIEQSFIAGAGRLDWSLDTDPAAEFLTLPGLAALLDAAPSRKPTRQWRAQAQALITTAGSATVARQVTSWLAALGPADAHRAATPEWQQIGTLRLLVDEMDKALNKRLKVGGSALQKAARHSSNPAIKPLEIPRLESSRHAGNMIDPSDKARRAAHRQFGYWGRLPHVDPKTGLRKHALLPGDPRCLSAANANRACGAAWLLALAVGSNATAAIAAAADSLAVKVYQDVGYPAPRSVVAAKACLELLAGFETAAAKTALAMLGTRIEHPPLCKFATQHGI